LAVVAVIGICSSCQPVSVQAERSREGRCGQSSGIGYCLHPGPSPLLVLLSGLGNDMQDWSPSFLRALNRFTGVLIHDRRGYGESAPFPSQPVTAKAAAADLHELLQTLHIRQPVVLVGHSLGGLYAQYFARNYPQAVEAVVLIDASSPFEPIDDPRFHTRAVLEPGTTDYLEDAGFESSVRQTREVTLFPEFERAYRFDTSLPSGREFNAMRLTEPMKRENL